MQKRCRQTFVRGSTRRALAFLLAVGCAGSLQAADRYVSWRAAASHVLAGDGDANSLATAAALRFVGAASSAKSDAAAARSEALDLAAKASELEPQNPSIAWLRVQLCAAAPGCDIRDTATTLRWLDADNAAVWMATLALAQRDKDSMEVDRTLQEMAQGSRFDVYRNRMVVLFFTALKRAADRLPTGYAPSDLSRLSEAMVVTNAEIVPSFAPLLGACREAPAEERRDNCLKLSKSMQHGDTVAAQMAGFTIEKRLSAPDGKEARLIAERRRVLEWRAAAAGAFDVPLLPWSKNSLARGRIAQMRATPREEDVDIAILRQHKSPLEPPDGHP